MDGAEPEGDGVSAGASVGTSAARARAGCTVDYTPLVVALGVSRVSQTAFTRAPTVIILRLKFVSEFVSDFAYLRYLMTRDDTLWYTPTSSG